MSNIQLNLARKWRSKQFNQIIGQELVISLVKNSLYRNLIFPVYLFAGTRGSGKTSTARLFASALNCSELENFQQTPQNIILPCLSCVSCNAMQNLAHHDFIEVDAASNTGVENIRQLIDTASFVPVLGKKKIYLIDEAHMLSKAAFNALLKILEEPPQTVVFILATTDVHKIIDTVRSRCFQLFFSPVKIEIIVNHLSLICNQENISYDPEGLLLIAQESEGSVRDAINLLERIRLTNKTVTKASVFESLGFIDDSKLYALFTVLISEDISSVLNFCINNNLRQYNAFITWKKFVEFIHKIITVKAGVKSDLSVEFRDQANLIIKLIELQDLLNILEICYSYEAMFAKTTLPYSVLELLLIKICQQKFQVKSQIKPQVKPQIKQEIKQETKLETQNNKNNNIYKTILPQKDQNNSSKLDKFLVEIDKLSDPLLSSIFKQAKIILNNSETELNLSFNKDLEFFKDLLEDTKNTWSSIINKVFGQLSVIIKFDNQQAQVNYQNINYQNSQEIKKSVNSSLNKNKVFNANNINSNNIKLDISDQNKWPKANIISKIFPGKITCLIDKRDN